MSDDARPPLAVHRHAAHGGLLPAPPSADALLVRGLGVRQLTATIFNYTVGSGIFVLPALVVAQLGAAAPLAYLLCAVVMALVVLVFAEAGSRVTETGGPYAYVRVALGPFVALVAGVLLTISDVAASGALAMVLAGSIVRLVAVDATTAAVATRALALLLLAALALLNVRGVRTGARIVELSTFAKLVPLLAFVAVGAFFVEPRRLAWTATPGVGQVTTTAGTLLFAFVGIEAALQPSGEVRHPSRTVPRAAMLALAAATLLYLAVQTVALGVLGPALADDRVAPLAGAAAAFAGGAGRALLLVGAAISTFGFLTGALLAGPRGLFALGRDGFLPRRVAAVHPRHRTPHVAIALYAVLAGALALTGTFEQLAVLTNVAVLALYFLSAIAAWLLRRRDVRGAGEPFRAPGGPLVPALTCAVVAYVMVRTVTPREVVAVGGVLVVTAAAYAVRARRMRAVMAGAG